MAQELREGDGKAGIARAGKRKWGYDPAQVDSFLERAHTLYDSEGIRLTQRDIQAVSFDLTKDGYVIAQVDAALNRLERAVVDKQTAWEIAQHGRVTWKAQTENLYQQILEHVEREQGERFKPGEAKQPSYDKKQVDRLTDQIVDKAAASLGVDGVTEDDVRDLADLNAVSVSNVIFTQRKGKKGYDERQVDYFLNACVQLLSRIESYARVGGASANEPAAAAAPAPAAAVAAPAEAVSPLFAANAQRPAADARFASQAAASDDAFDALHQAEQNLFVARPAAEQADNASAPAAYQPASYAPASSAAPQPVVSDAPSFGAKSAPAAPSTPAVPAVPVAPATPVTPVAPAIPPTAESDSSLAALAHMAQASQDIPAVSVPSFEPKMPSLGTPEELKLNDMPAPVTPAAAPVTAAAAAPAAPSEAPAAPEPPHAQTSHQPAPETMPVSFAPANKPVRTTGSVPIPVADHSDDVPAEPVSTPKPAAQPSKDAETKRPEQISDMPFPSLFPTSDDFNSSIPDLSFPTLDHDDTKKEQ